MPDEAVAKRRGQTPLSKVASVARRTRVKLVAMRLGLKIYSPSFNAVFGADILPSGCTGHFISTQNFRRPYLEGESFEPR
jgi:hypothetical protein